MSGILALLRRWWRPIQVVLGVTILLLVVVRGREAWRDASGRVVPWAIDPGWIAASLLITWVMYAVLITGWRVMLAGWGERLRWPAAARIWTISSLGGLIPGGVWAIAGMAVMAERAGVSAGAATGSAIAMQLLSISTGTILGLALVGPGLVDGLQGGLPLIVTLALGTLAASAALTSPRAMGMLTRVLRRDTPLRPLTAGALCAGIALNTVAWLGYGTALFWLARGTMPTLVPSWSMATGAFALGYLVGYILLVLPGGAGVREGAIAFLLAPQIGLVPAGALAIASRLATLTTQVGAAVPFLLFRSTERDHT